MACGTDSSWLHVIGRRDQAVTSSTALAQRPRAGDREAVARTASRQTDAIRRAAAGAGQRAEGPILPAASCSILGEPPRGVWEAVYAFAADRESVRDAVHISHSRPQAAGRPGPPGWGVKGGCACGSGARGEGEGLVCVFGGGGLG